MAYNNYYPVAYQPTYPQQQYSQVYPQQMQPTHAPVMPTQANSSSITWVQGEAGAKAHPMAPGTNGIFMDIENPLFYIKSVDMSGIPLPLRTFEYREVFPEAETIDARQSHDEKPLDQYATKEELNDIKRMLEEIKSNQYNQQKRDKGERNNGKQSV